MEQERRYLVRNMESRRVKGPLRLENSCRASHIGYVRSSKNREQGPMAQKDLSQYREIISIIHQEDFTYAIPRTMGL